MVVVLSAPLGPRIEANCPWLVAHVIPRRAVVVEAVWWVRSCTATLTVTGGVRLALGERHHVRPGLKLGRPSRVVRPN